MLCCPLVYRRNTYNHLSSWLTDARNLTNPNTVSDYVAFFCLTVDCLCVQLATDYAEILGPHSRNFLGKS